MKLDLDRRNFLKGGAAVAAGSLLGIPELFADAGSSKQPNILLVISDQLDGFTIGAAGCEINTPNIDNLAKEGCRFENANASFPLCVPWRSSMASGLYPHQFGLYGNNGGGRSPRDRANFAKATGGNTIYKLIRNAGYDCRFTGKWHFTMDPENSEFNGVVYEKARNASREEVCKKARDLINGHKGDKPFFITASFDTPHEICGWRRSHAAGKDENTPPASECPPLPDNYERAANVPEAVMNPMGDKLDTEKWDESDWRQHGWAYRHYTERMDQYLGEIMKTLEESGHADDTLVVFVADHGDGNGSHRWANKVAMWEESIRVPLIFRCPGQVKRGHVVRSPISTGLDMMPTLCAFAGAEMPGGYAGTSLKGNCMGANSTPHEYVVSETSGLHVPRGQAKGLMLRTAKYKYIVYSDGANPEQFFDIENDPGEKDNRIGDSELKNSIEEHKELLRDWCEKSKYTDFNVPG